MGRGYYLLQDWAKSYKRLWPTLFGDGHPSYGPDGRVITDTYPDRRRVASIYLLEEGKQETPVLARVFAPFRYDNDVRCDLHPRWDRSGNAVCIDSVYEGKRELYVIHDLKNAGKKK